LVKNGLSPAKVAEDFSVHRSTVHHGWNELKQKVCSALNVNLVEE
jgi:transposase